MIDQPAGQRTPPSGRWLAAAILSACRSAPVSSGPLAGRKMKTCHYYLLIEPTRGGFHDTAASKPSFEITIETTERRCQLALFTDDHGLPLYGRLTIPHLPDESIPEALVPLIQEAKEHLLSALRFGWHQDVVYFPRPVWTFSNDDEAQDIGLGITLEGEFPFDADKARQVLVGGYPLREELRLLIELGDGRIPLQYRYLSGYKILELQFKSKGKWKKKDLERFLLPFQPAAKKLGVTKALQKYLHDLRDKCAHIRTGKDVVGVTHLSSKKAGEVEAFLPLLAEMALAVINARGGKAFSIHTGPKPLPSPPVAPAAN
jgi:hypothetical protein